ncbi:MAG: riboflavin synthase [Gracilibacteraceae bacterium]|jgi:riboflavin synthase|nr:riboflavin synthase [Gracilibacteraceae bacterium]
MFTGIIEETGVLERIDFRSESALLTVKAARVLSGTVTGDSIAVNGACLTVTSVGQGRFTADAMPETLRSTAFRSLGPGAPLNLERALTPTSRLGGHIVSGHVDGVGVLRQKTAAGVAELLTVEGPPAALRFMIPKGSVALDGISLTLVTVTPPVFTVSVIPHTLRETTLGRARPGTAFNLETDILGKYVAHFLRVPGALAPPAETGGLTLEFLRQNGF